MRGDGCFIRISLMVLAIGFSVGCGKEEPAASQPSLTPPLTGNWQATMPAKFAGLSVKDGGACYLDAVNAGAIGDGPFLIKSGSQLSLAGWAVADLKAGRLGSAVGVQLHAATPYFIAAESYVRPGLGAALKSPALEGGGFKLDATPLNVPAGDYRVLFLIQSDHDLLRCDTGRTLRVQ